ncbi:hypothetical protein Pst134EA_020853 [Puccinia striiformis f. sp. tritici]|uniref:hypothetical protein n=1 Tax=Puccinia striiformis f. sp. tritici TaxID=168172 RepID=UPI002008AB13|nr:hypothetical protein Pst134EA_020853 [Puccinia striiformis f. sp. tritici]KAH9456947.1 hypothetical protein Pst134EA_020853 [Puccinia striiformis f. sp. tritici]KAI9620203.1 hypothetical protein H4Q26_013771 [Puccinia striiformis f. sp. tritici PST-130]
MAVLNMFFLSPQQLFAARCSGLPPVLLRKQGLLRTARPPNLNPDRSGLEGLLSISSLFLTGELVLRMLDPESFQ